VGGVWGGGLFATVGLVPKVAGRLETALMRPASFHRVPSTYLLKGGRARRREVRAKTYDGL